MQKLRHLPVASLDDVTHNFEQLESESPQNLGTIRIPKLTAGGKPGQLTIREGLIVSFVSPT
jgi:hypothetical protein